MTFTFFLVIMGVAAGLDVGPVHLADDREYISYQLGPSANNSLLECPIQLSQGETLQKVTWVLWDGQQQAGTYHWFPNGRGEATGLLEGVVNLSMENENLELTSLRYDLGGFYSCSATLTDGLVQEADKWEALIIDTTSNHYISATDTTGPPCTFVETIKAPAVFPAPTVRAGIYSKKEGVYSEEVTDPEWHKVVYSNQSTAYSFEDRLFELDEHTQPNSVFHFSLGVTKSDGFVISFTEIISNLIGVDDGCVLPKLRPHQVIQYTGSKNCIGRLTSSTDIQAYVTCEKGYIAASTVNVVLMECSMDNFTWTVEDNLDLGKLQCVADGGSGGITVSPAVTVLGTSLLFLIHLFH